MYSSPFEQGQGNGDPRNENPYGGFGNKTTGAGGYNDKSGNFSTDDNKLGGGQGGGENKITTASTVQTAPTTLYASPYEQGNGLGPEWNGLLSLISPPSTSSNNVGSNNVGSSSDTSTNTVSTPVTTTALPATANITDDSMDAWLESLEADFDLKTGLTNKSIQANTDLINDNIATINTNQQSSDDMFSDQEEDLSSLFFEQRNQGDDIASTNLNVDEVATDLSTTNSAVGEVKSELSDQQQELLALDASAKKLGLTLVDTEGVQVDIQKDIIDTQEMIKQQENSDLIAKTALENQVNTAVDSVTKTSEDVADDSFNVVVDNQDALGEDLVKSGFNLDNIINTADSETTDTDKTDNAQRYNQEYWASQLKKLQDDPATKDSAQSIVKSQIDALGEGAYSGAIITTDDQHFNANESLMALNSQLTDGDSAVGLGASPSAPTEYILESTLTNINQWVADGKLTVKSETTGLFDENTTSIYTIVDEDLNSRFSTAYNLGDEKMELVVKSTDATITIGGQVITLGNDTDTLFVNNIAIGTASYQGDGLGNGLGGDEGVVTIDLIGAGTIGAHVDDIDLVGSDDGSDDGVVDGTGDGDGEVKEEVVEEEEEVVEEEEEEGADELPDPNGTGAFGQDGKEFTLDGVTFWKRIKDRNGRWIYSLVESYQNNGTSSRRGNWGAVQNF